MTKIIKSKLFYLLVKLGSLDISAYNNNVIIDNDIINNSNLISYFSIIFIIEFIY